MFFVKNDLTCEIYEETRGWIQNWFLLMPIREKSNYSDNTDKKQEMIEEWFSKLLDNLKKNHFYKVNGFHNHLEYFKP